MQKVLIMALVGMVGCVLAGCSGSREVEVKGEVTAPASVSVQGEVLVDFFDVVNEDDAPKSVSRIVLDEPGPFTQKAELEGDTVRVRALNDRDGDGKCTEGEAWAEVDAPIGDDDSVAPITLTLANQACPAASGE